MTRSSCWSNEESCNEAAVDFLISELLKHALTKHKKGKETSVNPEEDQSVEDHGESLKSDRLNNYMYITTQNAGFLLSGFSRIWTESYPNFPVYG